MEDIYEIESLEELKSYLSKQDINTLRRKLFIEFLKYAEYKNAKQWNKAVRLCECLAIIGWGENEAVEAVRGIFFNGNPETEFVNKFGELRFVDAIWSTRKMGVTMEQGRTSYHQSPDLPSKKTISWEYPVKEEIQDLKLAKQRNWIPKNPILIKRTISNCYENSKLFIKSIEENLSPTLNSEMRPENYGSSINRIVFCCNYSYSDPGCKTNYIIADESLKLKHKDFYPNLLKMFSEKEIEKNGYYLRNRYEYGPFRSKTGSINVSINLEKEFSEMNFKNQKIVMGDYILDALKVVVDKLKRKNINYNFDLMWDDFLNILNKWKEEA